MKNYKIFHQSVFEKWPIEDNSVQAIITSPPYWGLRKYNISDVMIGGDVGCRHEWGENVIRKQTGGTAKALGYQVNTQWHSITSFCIHCNAWQGQYGLEPSYKDYIKHTLLWAKEAWRVLRNDGIFFLNIGDSYSTQSESGVNKSKNVEEAQKWANISQSAITMHEKHTDLPSKCKLLIPHRIAIALIDEGWILRNDIVWTKNTMPESCQDRFSKKWESVFMFVKNKKYYFDLNPVKEPTRTKDNHVRDRDTTRLNNIPGRAKMSGLTKNNYDFKNPGDVWNINTKPSTEKHYAMWPEKLVERMLLCSTKENDTILDPFCGSATTLKTAVENRRKALGIDLGYSDIQERKLKNIQIKMF